MGDRLAYDMALAEILTLYYGMWPPVLCAPAIGVHQGCEHAEQSRAVAHFTVEQGGTCTRNSRLVQSPQQAEPGITWADVQAMYHRMGPASWVPYRNQEMESLYAAVRDAEAELAGSTVAPPVDASGARAVAHDRDTCELALWCGDCYDIAHDEMDERETCDAHAPATGSHTTSDH